MIQVGNRAAALVAGIALAVVVAMPVSAAPAWSTPIPIAPAGNVPDASPSAPSVRFGPNGSLHVAYMIQFGASRGLYYATDSTGSWQSTKISTASNLGDEWTSIDVDSNGYVHIAYQQLNSGIYYLTNRSGSWVKKRLRTSSNFVVHPEIAVDSANKVHVVFFVPSSSNSGLRYSTNASGSWVTTQITTNAFDTRADVAVDAARKVHILIGRSGQGYRYLTNKTGSWKGGTVLTGIRFASHPSIDLDSLGRPVVAYTSSDSQNSAIGTWTAVKTAGGWTATKIQDTSSPGVEVRVAPDGWVHVGAFGGSSHYSNESGSWVRIQVAADAIANRKVGFDIAADGHLAMVYVRSDYSLALVTRPASD